MSNIPSLMQYSLEGDYFEHDCAVMLPFVPDDARMILEVGCASGKFGELVKEKLPQSSYWGIEPAPLAAQAAKARLDKVYCGLVEDFMAELPDAGFDTLIFNDVLEHLVDPQLTLGMLLGKLESGGLVVISIPNVLFIKNLFHLIVRKDWRYEDFGIRDRTHLRFFTKRSVTRILAELKLVVEKTQGIYPTEQWLLFALFDACTLGFWEETRYANFAVTARLQRLI